MIQEDSERGEEEDRVGDLLGCGEASGGPLARGCTTSARTVERLGEDTEAAAADLRAVPSRRLAAWRRASVSYRASCRRCRASAVSAT